MKRLGIDLGTSSLGWAILDDERIQNAPYGSAAPSPIDCGVIVFPEGMDRDKSDNLQSRAAERRQKRAARRIIRRRKYRKFHILKVLQAKCMCPIKPESIELWQKKGIYPLSDTAFTNWLKSTPDHNPYSDRKFAAEKEVSPETFGRAIYHIAQRRGFKSSKKELIMEESIAEEASEKKGRAKQSDAAKELGETKAAIADLTAKLNGKTLGQYFYECFQKNVEPKGFTDATKIRGHKTSRDDHYRKEFEIICEKQRKYVSKELQEQIGDILFFQRPLRIQRHLVGWCTIEKPKIYKVFDKKANKFVEKQSHKYKRCFDDHPTYQRFKLLSVLNNFKIRQHEEDDWRRLTPDERAFIIEKCTVMKRNQTVGDIMEALNKDFFKVAKKGEERWRCKHRDSSNVPTLSTEARFLKLALPKNEWQAAFNALCDFQDVSKLKEWAKKRYCLDDKGLRTFLLTNPSTERGDYSLHAITRIIPWLEKGYMLHKALFLAKLPEIIPNFAKVQDMLLAELEKDEKNYHEEKKAAEAINAETHAIPKVTPLKERYAVTLRSICKSELGMSEDDVEKLMDETYLDNTQTDTVEKVLPPVDMGSIRNPMVLRALTILRRLINQLRKDGKINWDTPINIELARNVNSSNMCRAIEKHQIERKKQRDEARANLENALKKEGINCVITEELLLKYELWEEQGYMSAYTGQSISLSQMVTDCDIEHTIPRARGGTSKRENLTLCESHYNRDIKKNKLPLECPNAHNAFNDSATGIEYPPIFVGKVLKKWKADLDQLEKNCIKNKPKCARTAPQYADQRQRYLQYSMERDYLAAKISTFETKPDNAQKKSFMPRQLADIGSISSFAIDFLKTRYTKVYPRNGAATAFARKAWGLQAEDEAKDRSDHTHHAMDAIVIAALDTKRFQQICTELGKDYEYSIRKCKAPYEHFGEMAHKAVESILVRNILENRQIQPFQNNARRNNLRLATPVKQKDGTVIRQVSSVGKTVRGHLHDDTIYGKINHHGEETTVVRKILAAVDTDDNLIKIANAAVDESVRNTLLQQIEAYKNAGVEKNKLKNQIFWGPKDKDGTPDVNGIPMKKVRICVSKPKNPDKIRSTQEKIDAADCHSYMYGSGGDLLQLEFFEDAKGNLTPRNVSVLDVSKQGVQSDAKLILRPGMLALAYEESPNELRRMDNEMLSKRLYVLRKFRDDGMGTFVYHKEARKMTEIMKYMSETHDGRYASGVSNIKYDSPEMLMLISPEKFIIHMLFEGRDFTLSIDGKIEWINKE